MRVTLATFATFTGLVAGCLAATPGACATSPSLPLEVDLRVADACALYGDGSEVAWTIRSAFAVEHAEAGLDLGPGVEIVSGDFAYEGPLADDGSVTRRGVVRAVSPADADLRAWYVGPLGMYGPGAGWGAERAVRVRWNDGAPEALFHPGGEGGFTARLAAEPGNATRLLATVTAPQDVTARVHLYFSWGPFHPLPEDYDPWANPLQEYAVEGHPEWTGEPAWRGDVGRNAYLEWIGPLEAGVPLTLRFHAPVPPQDGTYTVSAHLRPDPRVDAHGYADEAYLRWEAGQGTLVRGRPVE